MRKSITKFYKYLKIAQLTRDSKHGGNNRLQLASLANASVKLSVQGDFQIYFICADVASEYLQV